jgi:hypothetical protein
MTVSAGVCHDGAVSLQDKLSERILRRRKWYLCLGLCGPTSASNLALAIFACGRLTRLYGLAGLGLALVAAALKRRIET